MSLNRGIFLEFVSSLAENGDHILVNYLQEASSNATYLSPRIQNEMIEIVGHEIQLEIVRRVKKSGVFAVLMDETTDVLYKNRSPYLSDMCPQRRTLRLKNECSP